MKKIILGSLVSLFTFTLTSCGSPDPIKDGVCVEFNPSGLPSPIDPDCLVPSKSGK